MMPLFSILHTSARPHKWREIYDAWMKAAINPDQVEYVLCVDARWGFTENPLMEWQEERLDLGALNPTNGTGERSAEVVRRNLYVWNRGRRCYVDGVNTAARHSTGRILIVNADDQYPCAEWDEELSKVWIASRTAGMLMGESASEGVNRDFVMEVSTGTPDEHSRHIMVMPILSRSRYERRGYVFYPEYESMFADNDFCDEALKDGCIIDARHLLFPHRHPLFDQGAWNPGVLLEDPAYKTQNRKEAYDLGYRIFSRRKVQRFPVSTKEVKPVTDPNLITEAGAGAAESPRSTTLALCISGESFHWEWVSALLRLHTYLGIAGFLVWTGREYTSNVYVTREQIRKVMMETDPKPDLFLWLDDDNPAPTPEEFGMLLQDLVDHPEADGVTAWCWIYDTNTGTFHPSCGTWAADNLRWRPFDTVFFPQETNPRDVEVTGFPCFLMKRSALEKAGNRPFLPILDEVFDQGISGEDVSFCSRAQDGGAKFLVDPRVRVKHLKISDATPGVPSTTHLVDPKIAVMMRVKNEARWIERCINSVIPLAGENVFVMDDESTDETFELARATGVNVYRDPFAGEPLDETRDKAWLLEQVKSACDPDWILCIDGDEELEPDGAEMIRRILSTNPDVDVFALNFLFLWDSVDQIRVDGRYSSLGRESLFRAKTGLEFRSYYEAKGGGDPKCHVGLHCGNAPVSKGRRSPINVNLLHYGYIFREDRIRKYNWYRSIDPDNPYEDNYRHIVLGDLPELPASMKTAFGGPLKLIKLTKRMVPKFNKPLEPLRDEVTA